MTLADFRKLSGVLVEEHASIADATAATEALAAQLLTAKRIGYERCESVFKRTNQTTGEVLGTLIVIAKIKPSLIVAPSDMRLIAPVR